MVHFFLLEPAGQIIISPCQDLVDCIRCAFGNDFIKQGLMVVGGLGGRGDLSSTEVYLPSTKQWTKSAGVLPRHVRENLKSICWALPLQFG